MIGVAQVVRSGPAFALSLVLSSVEPVLRSAAELGAWQIISPVSTSGRVVEVQGLHEVQDMVRFEPHSSFALNLTSCPAPAVWWRCRVCVKSRIWCACRPCLTLGYPSKYQPVYH